MKLGTGVREFFVQVRGMRQIKELDHHILLANTNSQPMDRWVGIVAVTSDRVVNKENAHSAWAGKPFKRTTH